MNQVTMGQKVVVIERHHPLAYREGAVVRAEPDELGRVRVHFSIVDGDLRADGWHAIELPSLGAVPATGERYQWADRNNTSRVPFTVGERFEHGHANAGLFRVMADDAREGERVQGHSSIASAAEIAKYAERVLDAPAPATGDAPLSARMRKWVADGMPRPWPQTPGKPVLAFADEVEAMERELS